MEKTVPKTTSRAAEAAHKTIDRVAARGEVAEVRAREMGVRVASRSREMQQSMRGYLDKHPFRSLGIAVLAGFVISTLFRRT